MIKWISRIWIGALLLVTLISIPQCLYTGGETLFNADGKQSALDPHGPLAADQLNTFYWTLWVTIFLFVTVGGALAYTIWRYRVKEGEDDGSFPEQSHGHPLVEVGLVVASTLLLVIIAIPTFNGILLKGNVPLGPNGEEPVIINVNGYQWWFGFEYPEYGFHTANEVVFPAGRPVQFNLHTNDVIHSFWIPKLGGKTDLMPGEDNIMWLQADEPGYFYGQCAEYCGESHAYMLFRAEALSEEDWEQWIEDQQRATIVGGGDYTPVSIPEEQEDLVLKGTELFVQNCVRCHSVDSKIQTMGPNLAHFGSRTSVAAGWLENDPESLHRWIKDPESVKPGSFMWFGFPTIGDPKTVQMEGLIDANLSDEEVDAIVAYLYTLQ